MSKIASGPTIFVDSDAFIALARKDDANHQKALAKLSILEGNYSFMTSNYVFSEVVTVLSLRISRKAALAFIKELKSPKNQYNFIWIDAHLESLGIKKYQEQTTKNVSLTDCINMACLDEHKIKSIFSFDAIYRKNGYRVL